jgi:hypothetical protein
MNITCPAEELFSISQDYSLRQTWDPFVRQIKFLDGAIEPAVGVRVWVKTWSRLTMQAEYTSFTPPAVAAIKMVQGPYFLKTFAGAWKFNSITDIETNVEFLYSFSTRWNGLRWLLDQIIKAAFHRDIQRRLVSLKGIAEDLVMND